MPEGANASTILSLRTAWRASGGGRGGIFGAAGSRHARAVCLERAGGAFGTHAGTRAAGGGALHARWWRRTGERGYRAAVWAEFDDFCKRGLTEHASSTCSLTASPSGFGRVSGARRSGRLGNWRVRTQGPPGADGWLQGGRRDGAGGSFRTYAAAGSAIRCWSFPTARRGSSGRLRNAFPVRRASAAWRTGCVT